MAKQSEVKLSKHVPKANDFKVPWWSRLLGDFRARKRAKQARNEAFWLCTITVWASDGVDTYPAWFHLSESQTQRFSDFYAGAGKMGKTGYRTYHSIIIPWLNGKLSNEQMVKLAIASEDQPK